MLKLGELNSRMKDFFDIWLLSRQFDFDGNILTEAERLTLEHRGTKAPNEIAAFSKAFIDDKQVWNAFRNRLGLDHVPEDFGKVVAAVEIFIKPIADALASDTDKAQQWKAPGPWQ